MTRIHSHKAFSLRSTALIAAAAATLALAACDRDTDTRANTGTGTDSTTSSTNSTNNSGSTTSPTAGERVDSTISGVRSGANEAGRDMNTAATNAGNTIATGAADMTITTKIKAALAADTQLSAMAINVDTVNGRVSLNGTAPSTEARERANTLVNAVDGVTGVDNNLTIASNS